VVKLVHCGVNEFGGLGLAGSDKSVVNLVQILAVVLVVVYHVVEKGDGLIVGVGRLVFVAVAVAALILMCVIVAALAVRMVVAVIVRVNVVVDMAVVFVHGVYLLSQNAFSLLIL
jgi:hypothetical protein